MQHVVHARPLIPTVGTAESRLHYFFAILYTPAPPSSRRSALEGKIPDGPAQHLMHTMQSFAKRNGSTAQNQAWSWLGLESRVGVMAAVSLSRKKNTAVRIKIPFTVSVSQSLLLIS